MRLSTRTQIVLILLAFAAAWLGGLFWFVRDTESMSPPAAAKPLDAIVVLTGGTNRMETGFSLLEKNLGKKLYISGVYRGTEVRTLMKLFSQEKGGKLDCCVALGNAENTMGNAAETAAWLEKEKSRTFYLVTSNYHMRRALLEFGGRAAGLEPVPWPVSPDGLDMKGWWHDPSFRGLVIREYSKYLLALVRYAVTR
jgi:uncharacterized SAM-binding protein YcdF (DUF218 family)